MFLPSFSSCLSLNICKILHPTRRRASSTRHTCMGTLLFLIHVRVCTRAHACDLHSDAFDTHGRNVQERDPAVCRRDAGKPAARSEVGRSTVNPLTEIAQEKGEGRAGYLLLLLLARYVYIHIYIVFICVSMLLGIAANTSTRGTEILLSELST